MNLIDKYFNFMEVYFPFINPYGIGLGIVLMAASIPFIIFGNLFNKALFFIFKIIFIITIITIIGSTIYILMY